MLFISKNTPCYRMSYHLCVPILIPLHRYGTLIASFLSLFCIIQLFFLFLMETCSFYLSYGLLDPNISFSLTCQQNYLECLHSLSSNPLITFFFEITLIELPTISHPTSRKLLLFRKVSNEFNLLNLSVTFLSLVYSTQHKHFMQLTILHHRKSFFTCLPGHHTNILFLISYLTICSIFSESSLITRTKVLEYFMSHSFNFLFSLSTLMRF